MDPGRARTQPCPLQTPQGAHGRLLPPSASGRWPGSDGPGCRRPRHAGRVADQGWPQGRLRQATAA
eukprot:15097027-Alexandrium_andersonii.AAC.1